MSESAISERTGRPIAASERCIGLTSGVKITFQITATTIGGNTMGRMNAVRTASRKRDPAFSSNARPSPIASCNPTVATDSFACTHSEFRKRASPRSAS